jgi:toxin ParE1/3/4
MSTMNISLPETLKTFVDMQVSQRGYGTSSEYVRELIRKDQDRLLALRGVEQAVAYRLEECALSAALSLMDAFKKAYAHIGPHPATGSPKYAHELNLPGLRFWPLTRYPHGVFYTENADHIDVWRVLHGQRDIHGWLLTKPD